MIKEIVTDKDKLTSVCSTVNFVDEQVNDDLLDTANSVFKTCAGLAAPQIGYLLRVIVVKLAEGFVVMTNPEYIEKSGKFKGGLEGCLSRPITTAKPVNVKRYYKVKIKYTDIDGNQVVRKFKNFEARVVQHEIDHLDGILI